MNGDSTVDRGQQQGSSPYLVLAGLTVLAVVLRFARLGTWSFDSDEIFLLRDSINVKLTNPRPLLYHLNHYVVAPLLQLDEFGLRVPPALFGALAVPVLYLVARRLAGPRAALFAAFLLTVSPTHVIYSQFGRYWTLVFLFCAVYPYALYIGARERSRGALLLGIVTGLLALLAHPASVLLVGGPLIWLAWTYLRPQYLKAMWSRQSVRWGSLVALLVVAAILVRFVPILQRWIWEHDENPASGQFLLRSPPRLLKPAVYILAYVEAWTVPVVLIGALGIYLLWQGRDRTLGVFLASLILFPLTFLCLIMFRTPVSTYYLLPAAPVLFLGAGVFLDRAMEVDWRLRPRWLAPALLLVLVLIPGTPTLVSQYLNGRRFDFKGVAQWLQPSLTPGDVIFSDQPVALGHYLPDADVRHLRYNTTPLSEAVRAVGDLGRGGALWIVAPAPAHAFRTNLRQGGLARWIYDNCQLRNTVGRSRVDFRQQYLQVYRCPPAPGSPTGDS
jgi:hypothetical protein